MQQTASTAAIAAIELMYNSCESKTEDKKKLVND